MSGNPDLIGILPADLLDCNSGVLELDGEWEEAPCVTWEPCQTTLQRVDDSKPDCINDGGNLGLGALQRHLF